MHVLFFSVSLSAERSPAVCMSRSNPRESSSFSKSPRCLDRYATASLESRQRIDGDATYIRKNDLRNGVATRVFIVSINERENIR